MNAKADCAMKNAKRLFTDNAMAGVELRAVARIGDVHGVGGRNHKLPTPGFQRVFDDLLPPSEGNELGVESGR